MKIEPNLMDPPPGPLRNYVKSFPLCITILDQDDNIIREEIIDYGNFEHRKFLGRITFWACSSNYIVETKKA